MIFPTKTLPFINTKYLLLCNGLLNNSSTLPPVCLCPNILAFITFVSLKNISVSLGIYSKRCLNVVCVITLVVLL